MSRKGEYGYQIKQDNPGARSSRVELTNTNKGKDNFYNQLHLDKASSGALNTYRGIKQAILGWG